MKTRVRWFITCLLLLVAASTQAADKDLRYLQPNSLHPTHLLPAPPSVGSEEYKSEIDQILAIQAARTPAQIKRFQAEEKLGLAAFAGVMPDSCTADNLPKLDKLLKAAINESKYFGGVAKDFFQRKRPYREDSRIQPLGPPDEECAYPSGHATRGILCATILAQLDPSPRRPTDGAGPADWLGPRDRRCPSSQRHCRRSSAWAGRRPGPSQKPGFPGRLERSQGRVRDFQEKQYPPPGSGALELRARACRCKSPGSIWPSC